MCWEVTGKVWDEESLICNLLMFQQIVWILWREEMAVGEWVRAEWKQRELLLTAVQVRDDGGFYGLHLTDEDIVVLWIYTIITASLAF